MNEAVSSKEVFEVLVKHLVDIEEEKERLLERYYPETTDDREDFETIFDRYFKEIESYISNTAANDIDKSECPFVIIGSVVELEAEEDNELETYEIVSPFESKINSDFDCASYLSPMGRALLLKKKNDKIDIETPMGKFAYIVKAIKMPQKVFAVLAD